MIRALLLRIADRCARPLPPEWRDAARAEAHAVASTRDLAAWTLGMARLSGPPAPAAAGVVAAAVAVAWLDLHVEAAQTSLAALLLAAATAGAATRRPLFTGVTVGAAIAAAHLVLAAAGRELPHGHPHTALGSLALLVLVAPALAGAYAGSAVRVRLRP